MKYSLGSCTIDTEAYEIRRGGQPVAVEPQVFDLLVLLLNNRGRLVTKDEIFQHIWNGRAVTDAALSSRVRSMREAIGDDGVSQAFIRTVRRRGFRLVGAVAENGEADESADAPYDDITVVPRVESVLVSSETVDARAGTAQERAAAYVGRLQRTATADAVRAPFPLVNAALGMPAGPGIAVLPFANPAGDAALDFVGGAITEEIITELTRYSELRVAAR